MRFLINAPKKRARKGTRKVAKRRVHKRTSRTISPGVSMAAKRRRRKRTTPKTTSRPRRRHRRRRTNTNPGALAAARKNPARRSRRRRAVAKTTRRRYRRNPSLLGSSRGIVGGIVQGLKDGGAVVGGQVVTRKLKGAITGMLPANAKASVSSGVGAIALSLVSAVATSLIAKRVLPSQSRLIAAGAFSETINQALAATPIAPYLAGYSPRRFAGLPPVAAGARSVNARRVAGVSAWPGASRAGLAAWPVGQPRSVGMPHGVGVM